MTNVQRICRTVIPGFTLILSLIGCTHQRRAPDLKTEEVKMVVDDNTIDGDDWFKVIEPVWWTINIYDGPLEFDRTSQRFSRPQRLFHAIQWYVAEVNNGGHDQFYLNSTGIVWRNALDGLELLKAKDYADILSEAAKRLGGAPSMDRAERISQLDKFQAKFDDLDGRFYSLEKNIDLEKLMLEYARTHRQDFYFEGVVERVADH